MNLSRSRSLFEYLRFQGVTDICLCPGGRNAPLVYALDSFDFCLHSFIDERTASFFALGKAKAQQRPVAIITTSGTAVAECLPAMIESHYQNIPLVLISADRPASYRGSGAPQSIEQANLLGVYAQSIDITKHLKPLPNKIIQNLHLNICFDTPLLQDNDTELDYELFKINEPKDAPHPPSFKEDAFILVGELTATKQEKVLNKILDLQLHCYLEPLSGLKRHPKLTSLELYNLPDIKTVKQIIHIGGVPVTNFWRKLEQSHIPVLHFCDSNFSGLSYSKEIFSIDSFLDTSPVASSIQQTKRTYFNLPKKSEAFYTSALQKQIHSEDFVFLGNSLPIRIWDLVCEKHFNCLSANRGANGIDGLIASFFGQSYTDKVNWCFIGDLSFIYDSNALAFSNKTKHRIVISNNGGGMIFKQFFDKKIFHNAHNFDFSNLAKQWSYDYYKNEFPGPEIEKAIIELQSCPQANVEFWKEVL